MPKAYSYIRFSTPEQRLGDSLRRQIAAAEEYAAEHGLDIDQTLKDEGRSAYKGRHRDDKAALGGFLKAVEEGRIEKGSYFLVENFDRLSREEVTTALALFLSIIAADIIIVTLGDKRTYSKESVNQNSSELIISIVSMMRAHEESERKGEMVGKAWAEKRLLADEQKKAMTGLCPAWLHKVNDRYEVLPERADIVRQIFDDCIHGVGTRTIASKLNEQGVEPWGRGNRKGRHWHDSYIKKILENPAVLGEFTPHHFVRHKVGDQIIERRVEAGPPIAGYFPPIIERDIYLSARASMSARATSSVRTPAGAHRNVLSGLLRCETCGAGLHYISKGSSLKAGRPYLQCSSSLLKGGCLHKAKYPYEAVEGAVLMTIAAGAQDIRDTSIDLGPLKIEVEQAKLVLERLLTLVADGSAGAFTNRRVAQAEEALANAERLLSEAEAKKALDANFVSSRSTRINAAKTALALRERPEDREYRADISNRLRAIIERVTIAPGCISIYMRNDKEPPFRQYFADEWLSESVDIGLRLWSKRPEEAPPMILPRRGVVWKITTQLVTDEMLAEYDDIPDEDANAVVSSGSTSQNGS